MCFAVIEENIYPIIRNTTQTSRICCVQSWAHCPHKAQPRLELTRNHAELLLHFVSFNFSWISLCRDLFHSFINSSWLMKNIRLSDKYMKYEGLPSKYQNRTTIKILVLHSWWKGWTDDVHVHWTLGKLKPQCEVTYPQTHDQGVGCPYCEMGFPQSLAWSVEPVTLWNSLKNA